MIDLGISKLALIGVVALVVIGPEKLPRVARTVGALVGKAQRYVSDVKAEVTRSMELDELRKMKETVEGAARDVEREIHETGRSVQTDLEGSYDSGSTSSTTGSAADSSSSSGAGSVFQSDDSYATAEGGHTGYTPRPASSYRHPRKNWRVKRGATPVWYKQQQGVRTHIQSAAARVARFRPKKRI
ncbi:MAG: Sec-independent protein translocase subunit TatB [Ramlibacter sp.]|nr:Sec-independent protein translocase subunit TatB [Ramlibacter sp.]